MSRAPLRAPGSSGNWHKKRGAWDCSESVRDLYKFPLDPSCSLERWVSMGFASKSLGGILIVPPWADSLRLLLCIWTHVTFKPSTPPCPGFAGAWRGGARRGAAERTLNAYAGRLGPRGTFRRYPVPGQNHAILAFASFFSDQHREHASPDRICPASLQRHG